MWTLNHSSKNIQNRGKRKEIFWSLITIQKWASKKVIQKEKSLKRNSLKVYINSGWTLYKVFARWPYRDT